MNGVQRLCTIAVRLGAAGVVLLPLGVDACGHCDEDRVAAVYDHANVARALSRHQQIAYFALEGRVGAGPQAARAIERAVAAIGGVDAAGVRVSLEPASLAVAFDARRIDATALDRSVARALAADGMTTRLLRRIEQPGEFGSAGTNR